MLRTRHRPSCWDRKCPREPPWGQGGGCHAGSLVEPHVGAWSGGWLFRATASASRFQHHFREMVQPGTRLPSWRQGASPPSLPLPTPCGQGSFLAVPSTSWPRAWFAPDPSQILRLPLAEARWSALRGTGLLVGAEEYGTVRRPHRRWWKARPQFAPNSPPALLLAQFWPLSGSRSVNWALVTQGERDDVPVVIQTRLEPGRRSGMSKRQAVAL